MRPRALALAILFVLAGTGVNAADLPAATVAGPAQPWPRTWDWGGFYGGIHAGFSFGTAHNGWNIPAVGVVGTDSETLNGPLGGIQAGWNWHFFGWFVPGIEADIDFASQTGKATFNSAFTTTFVNGTVSIPHSETLNWFGTIRGRLGAAVGPVLVYGTGGVAFAQSREHISGTAFNSGDSSTAAFVNPATPGNAMAGWTVGGGGEVALGLHCSVRAEYLYADLGTRSAHFATLAAFTPGFASGIGTMVIHRTDNIVRLGFNFKFPPF
jgi:outer membrane immunogenic protein